MKISLRRLVPLLSVITVCALAMGGCSSKEAEQQLSLDLKSAAYLLQYTGQAAAAQYRLRETENLAAALRARTDLSESAFQEQVREANNILLDSAERLLKIQEEDLSNTIVYITNLPDLNVTQEHIDTMFENYRTASLSFSSYLNTLQSNGTRTNFSEAEAVLRQGANALDSAGETWEKLFQALSQYIADYDANPEGWGEKRAIKDNAESIGQARAAGSVLSSCFSVLDAGIQLSDIQRCLILEEESEARTALDALTQNLPGMEAQAGEYTQSAGQLNLDGELYAKAVSELKSTAGIAEQACSALENGGDASDEVDALEDARTNLDGVCGEVIQNITICTKQLLELLK